MYDGHELWAYRLTLGVETPATTPQPAGRHSDHAGELPDVVQFRDARSGRWLTCRTYRRARRRRNEAQ